MLNRTIFLSVLCALMMTPTMSWAASSEWQIDQGHTTIGFKVRHLGLSYVNGHFNKYEAKVMADDTTGRLTGVHAKATVKSIDTGIQKRNEHLHQEDFFYAEKHPELFLKLDRFDWTNNEVKATGTLVMRGVSKPVVFKGELVGTHKVDFGGGPQFRAGYALKTKVNRKDFGLSFGRLAEGVSVVSDDVEIQLDVQIWKKQ